MHLEREGRGVVLVMDDRQDRSKPWESSIFENQGQKNEVVLKWWDAEFFNTTGSLRWLLIRQMDKLILLVVRIKVYLR